MSSQSPEEREQRKAVHERILYEAARASYDQVDASIGAVEAKSQVWLGVVTFLLGGGAISLSAGIRDGTHLLVKCLLSLTLSILIVASCKSIAHLLAALRTGEHEGFIEPRKLVRDYSGSDERLYYKRYAEYLAEASHNNARLLCTRANSLKAAIRWTRWVLIAFMTVTLLVLFTRIWS